MIVLLIILSILILILLVPFGVRAAYIDESFALYARVGGFGFSLFPRKEKKKRARGKDKTEAAAADKPRKPKKPKKQRPAPTKEDIRAYIRIGFDALNRFRRKIVVNLLMLHISVASRNAYETAMIFGYLNTALSSILPMLNAALNIKKQDVGVEAAFEKTEMQFEAEIILTINLMKIISIGAAAGTAFLKYTWQARKKRKAAALSAERTEENAGNEPAQQAV